MNFSIITDGFYEHGTGVEKNSDNCKKNYFIEHLTF